MVHKKSNSSEKNYHLPKYNIYYISFKTSSKNTPNQYKNTPKLN